MHELVGGFIRNDGGGGMAQIGDTSYVIIAEDTPAWDSDFAINGNDIEVQVQDDGTDTVNWKATIDYMEETI